MIDEDSVSTRAVSSPSSALIPQWGRPSLHQLCPHTMCLWGGAARCAHTPGLMDKPLEKGVNPAGQHREVGHETKLVSCSTCNVNRKYGGQGRDGDEAGPGEIRDLLDLQGDMLVTRG